MVKVLSNRAQELVHEFLRGEEEKGKEEETKKKIVRICRTIRPVKETDKNKIMFRVVDNGYGQSPEGVKVG